MTPTPSIEISAQENLLQKYKERVERLPQPDQLIKICTDAGFLKTVWSRDNTSWQNILASSYKFAEPVTCREYRLPRDDKSNDPKGWIRENTIIGPVLEVTTSYLLSKYGVEIRNESAIKDNSHSWVRISHGLNKLVTELSNKENDDNEQETSTTKTEVFAFVSRSKAEARPRRPSTTCSSSRTVHILERKWIDIEPGAQFDQAYPVAKNKYSSSARRTTSRRWSDRILDTKRWFPEQIWVLSMLVWWKVEEQDGRRRRQQEKIPVLYWFVRCNLVPQSSSRSFRTQSHRSFTAGQSLNSGRFLQVHLSRWMCNQFTFHHKFRIDTGRTKFWQGQTDSILYSRESHGQGTQRSVQAWFGPNPVLHRTSKSGKRHQDTVYWVDIQLAQRKGLKFCQTRSNAVILYDTLPACCISKATVMKSEEIKDQRVYVSPRPPPTISNKDNWTFDLDFDAARSNKDIQRIELKPNTQLSSTGRHSTKWSEETLERTKFDRDTLSKEKHDNVTDPTSTGKPVCGHESTERCVLTPGHVEDKQTGTGRPVLVDQ